MFATRARSLKPASTFSFLFFFLFAFPAFATNWVVTSNADSGPGSLREAIARAANGDTITFNLPSRSTITLMTPLTLGPSVTITGPGFAANENSNLTISGGLSVGVFIVNAGATVSISALSIESGNSLLGGGVFNAGTLTLSDCLIADNRGQLGGGIFNSGTLTVAGCDVDSNVVDPTGELGLGGGIYNQGSVTLIDTRLLTNFAGTEPDQSPPPSKGGSGAGLYNDNGTATLISSTVENNVAASSGGGIYNLGPLIIFGPATATSSATDPPAGTLTLSGTTVQGNICDPSTNADCIGGAGIYNQFGTLTATNSTIFYNSNFSMNNSAGGGGILNYAGTVNLSFVTLTGNQAEWGSGTLAPGDIVNSAGTLTVKNSIIAATPPGFANSSANCSLIASGVAFSDGYNLSDDASCAGFLNQTGDLNSTPDGLSGGLDNNGGPPQGPFSTPLQTVALLPTSVAVDAIPIASCTDIAGNLVTTDQRGAPRGQPFGGKCDIGAFQLFQSLHLIASVATYDLIDSVQALNAPEGVKIVLAAPLLAAVDLINHGVTVPAIYLTEGFIDLVHLSQDGGDLTPAQATPLIGSAQQLIQDLTSPQIQ